MKIQIKLQEQAYLNNSANGDWKDEAYVAKAEINGLPGKVWWLVESPGAEYEEDACDWTNPYLIELETDVIDPGEHEITIYE